MRTSKTHREHTTEKLHAQEELFSCFKADATDAAWFGWVSLSACEEINRGSFEGSNSSPSTSSAGERYYSGEMLSHDLKL